MTYIIIAQFQRQAEKRRKERRKFFERKRREVEMGNKAKIDQKRQEKERTMKGNGHNKNVNFEKNIVAASGGKPLAEVAPLWKFSRFGVEENGFTNCQLCHSRVKQWIAIRNANNGVVLLIGHDCYDKLLVFLKTKRLESLNLSSLRVYIASIKNYCKQHINASFLAWFEAQAELPDELRTTLEFIKQFGYAPSLESAWQLVEYYKAHRRFCLNELMGEESREEKVLDKLFSGSLHASKCSQAFHMLRNEEYTLAQYGKLDLAFLRSIHLSEFDDNFFHDELNRTAPKISRLDDPDVANAICQWVGAARQATASHRQDAWKRAIIGLYEMVAENQDEYLLLRFRKGTNPKYKTPQWETRLNSTKYVLENESTYEESEGPVLVRERFEVAPGIVLVSKLTLVPCHNEPRYRWECTARY